MRRALSLTAALLSLAAAGTAQVIMRPPGEPPPIDAKRVLAPGQGVRLLLTDSTGRRFGRGPLGGAFFLEIPDAKGRTAGAEVATGHARFELEME